MKIKAYIYPSIYLYFFLKITGTDYLINLINTCKLPVNATYANTRLFIDY